ncbi:CocE/NonD family hydrolase [Anaerobium acetethylicum]|uniref:Putative hydrolase, CocE/NonD family n=1 Tax=Anaerobium acetethylicum TaxID=1619234 RepID=A0A1D3TX16_9FIRM|nr:CocE/NonD family hydrolase [Anaerobium acetethylicum]SCP98850.1 putative hydrolase, CocE/NonD family [Anaerobium acetethylicum]
MNLSNLENHPEECIESHMVEMRDGVKLYTCVIKPKKEGKFPIALCRCPYNQRFDEQITLENYTALNVILHYVYNVEAFVLDGYCVVFQHCRGTGNSGGPFQYVLYEFEDGCDTLDWLRTQDFYNEEIYRFGGSYFGMTSLVDAGMHYKDIKAIVANVPNTWPYEAGARNGFFKTGLLGMWEHKTRLTATIAGTKTFNYTPDVFRTFPQKDWGKLIYDFDNPMYESYQKHPNENDPYWRSEEGPGHTMYTAFEELDVPTLFTTSWFDYFVNPLSKIWNGIIPEETRKKSAMLINPYGHGADGDVPEVSEVAFWPFKMEGALATEAYPRHVLNWFNHIRTGEPLRHVKEGEITFFPECGQKKWYYEKEFTNGEKQQTLYLNENRKLEASQGSVSEVTYLYNPYNPAVYYEGADHNIGFVRPGAEDKGGIALVPQDPPNWRYDVISFEAEPFEKETFLKGKMTADIHVKSDCEDTCFYVRVHLVKDGVTYGIRDDITSLCYQLGDYTPGEEVKLYFEFSPIVWDIKPGDQLRIDVTSSAFPLYSLHTNVKGNQAEVEKPKYAYNTVVFGKSTFTYQTSDLSADKYEIVEVTGK